MPNQMRKYFFGISAAAFSILILLMAFWTRPLLNILDPLGITFPLLYAATAVFLTAAISLIWKNRKKITFKKFALLAGIGLIYFYFFKTQVVKTEFSHLIIFSILVILIQQALPDNWAPWEYYFWPALLTLFVGALDEFMQLWIPNRWGDAKDIGFCVSSIILGMMISYAIGLEPDSKKSA